MSWLFDCLRFWREFSLSHYCIGSAGLWETSLLAAALFIFSAPHISYSQDGRGYALTIFLALILTLSAIRLVQNIHAWGVGVVLSGPYHPK